MNKGCHVEGKRTDPFPFETTYLCMRQASELLWQRLSHQSRRQLAARAVDVERPAYRVDPPIQDIGDGSNSVLSGNGLDLPPAIVVEPPWHDWNDLRGCMHGLLVTGAC